VKPKQRKGESFKKVHSKAGARDRFCREVKAIGKSMAMHAALILEGVRKGKRGGGGQ